jgi:hypothetical protein
MRSGTRKPIEVGSKQLVVMEQLQLVVCQEHGSTKITTVRSHYLTMTSEDIIN